ncbi:MAG: YIP1 family protein, partial [Candidatus Paceibacterota bacterium]
FKRYFSVFGRPSEILEAEKSHVSWGGTFRSLLLAIGIPVMAFTILITMLASNFVSESVKRMLSPLESITISSANGIITGLIAFLMFSALFFLGQFILFRCSKFLKGKGDFKTQTYIISFCAAPIFLLIMFLALITFFLISAMGGMAMVLFMIMGIALAIYAFVLVIKALMSIHGYGSSEAIKSLVAAGVVVGIITYILAMVFGAISFLNR